MTTVLLAVALALPQAAAAPTPAPPADAHAVVEAFYTAYRGVPPLGIPTGPDLARLSPFLSARLLRLLHAAQEHSARYHLRFPEDKPPFVDGDVFSSNFEGISSFAVGAAAPTRGGERVEVALTYVDPTDAANVISWTDAAIVVRERGRPVIDDFEFMAPWAFAMHGRLSAILKVRP